MPRSGLRFILVASTAYVVIGAVTAWLAGDVSSTSAVKDWRLAAWLLSLVVFSLHFAMARRQRSSHRRIAMQVAAGVALGALGLAALGPLRMHWTEPARLKLVLLSLLAWPVLTGVPAFLVALLGGVALDRIASTARASRSRVI